MIIDLLDDNPDYPQLPLRRTIQTLTTYFRYYITLLSRENFLSEWVVVQGFVIMFILFIYLFLLLLFFGF